MNRHPSPHYKSSIINKNLEKNIRSYPTELVRQNIGGLVIKSTTVGLAPIENAIVRISQVYTAIPTIIEDSIFGPQTASAVETFQVIFNLPVTGFVDFPTWYRISRIYVAVTRIAQ